MKDLVKWLVKTAFVAVAWVFILSIQVDDRPLFSYAHDIIIENSVVEALDVEIGEFLERVYSTAAQIWNSKEPAPTEL